MRVKFTSSKTLKDLWRETPFFPHPLDKGIYRLSRKTPLRSVYFENWVITKKTKGETVEYRPMQITSAGYFEPVDAFPSLPEAKKAMIAYVQSLKAAAVPSPEVSPVTAVSSQPVVLRLA